MLQCIQTSLLCVLYNWSDCHSKSYVAGIGISNLYGSCDLDLDWMTFIYELNLHPLRHTGYAKMNTLHQGFRKLLYEERRMVHLVTNGHFRSRDKDGVSTISSTIVENPMLHANLMALSVIEPEFVRSEFYIAP